MNIKIARSAPLSVELRAGCHAQSASFLVAGGAQKSTCLVSQIRIQSA
jgi:hypothetical protein